MRVKNKQDLNFLSFWSINDELKPDKLKAQLKKLKAFGLNGVIFHPRYYPNKPEYLGNKYMSIINDLVLYAKSINMEFWIYDENGWPSGTAGGEVLIRHPELCSQWAVIKKDDQIDIHNEDILYSFKMEGSKVYKTDSANGELHHIVLVSEKGVSSLDSKASEAFIEITHESYKKALCKEAFEYVSGFFSDEVHFPLRNQNCEDLNSFPWINRIGELYKDRYNEQINSSLPLLFIEGEGYEEFRIRFWEMLSDAIIDGFYRPINDWCIENGKKYTAHLKAEENPFFQIKYTGSCLRVLKSINLPAIDTLERYPGNNYFPRMLYSISAQFSTGDCLAECMGGSGWGITPEDFTNYILWLAGHGVNNFVLHINQFRLKSSAIHDWPPSMPCHLNWKEVFPVMLESIKKKAKGLTAISKHAEILIVTPTRGIMSKFKLSDTEKMNIHDGTNIPDTESGIITKDFLKLVEDCHKAGINYEFTEERIIEEYGVISNGYLSIGNREYNNVLIPKGCKWSISGNELINNLVAEDVSVSIPENWQQLSGIKVALKETDAYKNTQSIIPEQSAWKVDMPESNLLVLEFKVGDTGNLISHFNIENLDQIGELELICFDEVKQVTINGHKLRGVFNDEVNGFIYEIEKESLKKPGPHLIELEKCENGETNPVALISGKFAVKSFEKFYKNKGRGLKTKGPFVIKPLSDLDYNDLINSGLPFGKLPITIRKILEITEDVEEVSIKIGDIHADAAKIYVDRIGIGWCWGPQWTSNSLGLKKGVHEVAINIVPSTYNMFGPHRHIDGDRHIVSPDQYLGIKNFADRTDAPENTFSEYWNFVRFGIGGNVILLK
ncbi:MAG TPA: hypothetical protein VIK78_14795 [Ruminiclostridium sp.]